MHARDFPLACMYDDFHVFSSGLNSAVLTASSAEAYKKVMNILKTFSPLNTRLFKWPESV